MLPLILASCQTDTSIGKKSWCYIDGEENKTAEQIVHDLIDKEEIISGIYPPEKAQDALEIWNENSGKVFRILIKF
jgi:hypothetical protein